jgi:uncharacterized protein YdeI (YjbR/CyaY-like superfamily)
MDKRAAAFARLFEAVHEGVYIGTISTDRSTTIAANPHLKLIFGYDSHARETEIWLRIYKKGAGKPTVTSAQALDVALCWGWIDGIRKGWDDESFLQRYTPRRARSIWSQINREHVGRLIAAGRMQPLGQRQVEAAKADGRWDAAYAPIRAATQASIPDDLRGAIDANPLARKTFQTLGRMNLFALAFRTNNMKTPAGRARKIAVLVAMLARGETIVPEGGRRK